jgi:TonB family protein
VLADDAATELYELLTNSASKEVAVPRKEIAGLGLQLSALLESDSSQQPAEKSRPPALTIADIAPVPTSAPEVPPSFSDEQDASVEEEIPGGEEPSGEPGNLNEEVGVEQGAEPSATGNTQFRIRLLAALLILAVLTGAAYEKGVLGDWIVNRGVTASTERATGSSTAAVITKRSPASAVPEMALAGSPGEDVTVSDSLRNNGAAAASDAVTADRGEEAMLRKTGRSASTVIEGRQGARVVLASNDGAVPATDSMGDGYEPPRLVKAVNAVPPPEAVQDFVTGDVKFDALVDATGKVSSASVLSGPAALQAAALEALRRYEYKPAIKNGQSVPGHVTVSVKFWYEP